MEEIFPVGTWKTLQWNWTCKKDSKPEISKVEEFIFHMLFVYLAYPFSAYKIESGYVSPF
jgi:hypothetical protein